MQQTIIGREKEKEALGRCMCSARSEFVIVYGGRRVGKTYLVDNYFHGDFVRYDIFCTFAPKLQEVI